jgi:hypothetical protein
MKFKLESAKTSFYHYDPDDIEEKRLLQTLGFTFIKTDYGWYPSTTEVEINTIEDLIELKEKCIKEIIFDSFDGEYKFVIFNTMEY